MSWVESQLLYMKVPANLEQCVSCGDSFWWWELWQGRCGWCEDDAKQAKGDPK